MRIIPNCISLCRMFFSLFLFAVKPFSAAFYAIYIICGFSDMIDGVIARKTGVISRLGARLDTMADMTMTAVLFVVLYPIVHPATAVAVWIISIAMIRFASMVIVLVKYKTFAMLHTYGNKITGILLFLFPIVLPYIHRTALLYILCSVASLSAIEELMIHLTSRELEVDKQSLFVK